MTNIRATRVPHTAEWYEDVGKCLLSCLRETAEANRYGADLQTCLKEKHGVDATLTAVYVALAKLEKKRLITAEQSQVPGDKRLTFRVNESQQAG